MYIYVYIRYMYIYYIYYIYIVYIKVPQLIRIVPQLPLWD
jgi:hypothetical protein